MTQRVLALAIATLIFPATAEAKGKPHKPKAPKISEKDQRAIDALKKIQISDFDWRTDVFPKVTDGYFVSAIDSLLKLSPRALDEHFGQNPDGTLKIDDKVRLDVFFWEKQASGKFTKTWVKLDARPLLDPNGQPLIKPFGGKPMLPVLQQAYAQLREAQGFHKVQGGVRVADDTYADALFEALVGRPAEKPLELKATPPLADDAFSAIVDAASGGRPMVAATPFSATVVQQKLKDAVWTGVTSAGSSAELTLASIGMVEGRAYTLLEAKRVMMSDDEIARAKADKQIADGDVEVAGANKSVRYVYLRSAQVEHDAASVNARGVYRVPLRKFVVLFDKVYVGPQVIEASQLPQASR